MKLFRLAACALLATPLALFAQSNGGRPMGRPGGGGGPAHSTTGRSDGGGSRDDRGARGERNKEDMEQFREKMEAFCKEHAPRRWEALGGDKNPMKFGGMYFRFRGLVMLENQDPELYKIKVRQIEIDDEEYGLMKEIREARRTDNNDVINADTARLRDLSREYIASRINERSHRIISLQKSIDREKSLLASDVQNKDALIADRVESILNDTPSRSRSHDDAPAPPAGGDAPPAPGNP
jgi:hypothetical protein